LADVDRRNEVCRLETRVEELAGELAAAIDVKSRLELQCEESRQRAALDADEQLSQLQNELQASTDCCHLDLHCLLFLSVFCSQTHTDYPRAANH